MSKKINTEQIANELKGSSAFFTGQGQKKSDDVMTSQNDIMTSNPDVIKANIETDELNASEQEETISQGGLDVEKLQTIIKSLAEIPTSTYTTPIRLSAQEKKDVEDFIYITLRKNGLQGNDVSISKLARYCLRYLMKVHEQELVTALKEALQKDTNLPI